MPLFASCLLAELSLYCEQSPFCSNLPWNKRKIQVLPSVKCRSPPVNSASFFFAFIPWPFRVKGTLLAVLVFISELTRFCCIFFLIYVFFALPNKPLLRVFLHIWSFSAIFLFSQDWNSEAPPETDMEGFYNTSLPVFLFKMTDQNVRGFLAIFQRNKEFYLHVNWAPVINVMSRRAMLVYVPCFEWLDRMRSNIAFVLSNSWK